MEKNKKNFFEWALEFLKELFTYVKKESVKDNPVEIERIPVFGDKGKHVGVLQEALVKHGADISIDEDFGSITKKAISVFQKSKGSAGSGRVGLKTIEWLGLVIKKSKEPVHIPGSPKYPSKHPFHPRFEDQLPAPYTHLHPFDVTLSVVGEKEIPGKKHNPFIAHLHEHSLKLGHHSEGADYSDETPHCSSGLNWAADMSGCEKSDNALASSWGRKSGKHYKQRTGDWVEVGDKIWKKTGKQNHITLCDKRFNRTTAKYYTATGFNQGNSIKSSRYKVKDIKDVMEWVTKPGTVLAPIGILGHKPVPSNGSNNESTR